MLSSPLLEELLFFIFKMCMVDDIHLAKRESKVSFRLCSLCPVRRTGLGSDAYSMIRVLSLATAIVETISGLKEEILCFILFPQ